MARATWAVSAVKAVRKADVARSESVVEAEVQQNKNSGGGKSGKGSGSGKESKSRRSGKSRKGVMWPAAPYASI